MLKLIDFLFLKKLNLPIKFRVFSLFIILVIFIGFLAELLSIGLIVPLMTCKFILFVYQTSSNLISLINFRL